MSRTPHGPHAFNQYYEDLFSARWATLRPALLADAQRVAYTGCLTHPYVIDRASIAVAAALDVRAGHEVLDMCAAPGGKTLVLACSMGASGRIIANERSSARRARLHRVLDGYLPDATRKLIQVTGHDASRWGLHEPEAYDRVLADVPCSSERHVMNSPGDLAKWSPSRPRRLAQSAYAIACAAADSARSGGLIVYSTCALSPLENDGVVARLITRERGRLRPFADPPACDAAIDIVWEPTEFGWIVLPDRNNGAGPMYLSLLQK